MVVITMTKCPPRLRGDLSKWLSEINVGVYVGHVNAKVRDGLWRRVCENIKEGQATMVYTASNEQHMAFRVHNTSWKPVDFDGITLMQKPKPSKNNDTPETPVLKHGFSNAAHQRMARQIKRKKNTPKISDYIFIDIETTGLKTDKDDIIEIGTLYISENGEINKWNTLIKTDKTIPDGIKKLTGITNELCNKDGISLAEALKHLKSLIQNKIVVAYRAEFDINFLEEAYDKLSMEIPFIKTKDAFPIAKKLLELPNHQLETVAKHFSIDTTGNHRASIDCEILYQVFLKLNEF